MNDLGGQLMHAVDRENIPKVRELLDSGAPVDYLRPGSDLTPLHIAVSFSNLGLVRLLLERVRTRRKRLIIHWVKGK
jgi:ankyrin repeat protein